MRFPIMFFCLFFLQSFYLLKPTNQTNNKDLGFKNKNLGITRSLIGLSTVSIIIGTHRETAVYMLNPSVINAVKVCPI